MSIASSDLNSSEMRTFARGLGASQQDPSRKPGEAHRFELSRRAPGKTRERGYANVVLYPLYSLTSPIHAKGESFESIPPVVLGFVFLIRLYCSTERSKESPCSVIGVRLHAGSQTITGHIRLNPCKALSSNDLTVLGINCGDDTPNTSHHIYAPEVPSPRT